MIALSAREEWDYVLVDDRGTDSPTTFRLRPLRLLERIEVENIISESVGAKAYKYGTVNLKLLRAGLVGWTAMKDARGVNVPFVADPDGTVRDDALERLPSTVCMELANEILTRSTMSADDRKN